MRMSQSIISTLREVPNDAEIVSHQLMVRAGLIRKVASGIYSVLPLGLRVMQKMQTIIREELATIGGQEVLLPMVCPSDLWKQTGRWQKYGAELLRFKDRHGNEFCLGPTHEEVITDLVKQTVTSYKKLPLLLYQIQSKFRDEIRPRFGLMRGREFIMKDAYSFHSSYDSLDQTYINVSQAYHAIFSRCGLSFCEVEADNGSIGGSSSAEFMVTADTGEDTIIQCSSCSYASNIEAAEVLDTFSIKSIHADYTVETVHTPGLKTIQEQVDHIGIDIKNCLKSLLVCVDDTVVLVLLRGDYQLNEIKLRKALNATHVELASDDVVKDITGAEPGFAGPVGLKKKIAIVADYSVKDMDVIYAGANKTDYHFKYIQLGKEFDVDTFYDLRDAKEGDACPRCTEGVLSYTRGIEVGHIFKLGTAYSEGLNACFLDQNGKKMPFIMGCYGIGVGRTVAASIEQHHDEQGIVWPLALAPYHVDIVLTSSKDEDLVCEANSLYQELNALHIETVLDDRDDSPGVKFKDAFLIGFPFIVVVGKQFKQEGLYELQYRNDGQRCVVNKSELIRIITEAIK